MMGKIQSLIKKLIGNNGGNGLQLPPPQSRSMVSMAKLQAFFTEENDGDNSDDDENHYSDVTVAQSDNRRSVDGDDSVDVSDNDYGYDLYYGDIITRYFHSTTGIG